MNQNIRCLKVYGFQTKHQESFSSQITNSLIKIINGGHLDDKGVQLPPKLARTKAFCLKTIEVNNAFYLKQ